MELSEPRSSRLGVSPKRRTSDDSDFPPTKRRNVEDWLGITTTPLPMTELTVELEHPAPPPSDIASINSSPTIESRCTSSNAPSSRYSIVGDPVKFRSRLRQARVYDADKEYPRKPGPSNRDVLLRILDMSRNTPELSDEGYERLQRMLKVPFDEEHATMLFMNHFCLKEWEWSLDREISISTAYRMQWTRAASVQIPIAVTGLDLLPQPKPDHAYAYDHEAFRKITSKFAVQSVLENDPAFGGKDPSLISPLEHNCWPFLTIEEYWETDSNIARLRNMHNMSMMLHNRVLLRKKAGLPVPYGEAFIFGIDLSWRPGRQTHFCCAWVELDEEDQKETHWISTLLKIRDISGSPEDFERMRHATKNLIEYAADLNYPNIIADLTTLGRYLQEHKMFDAIARNSRYFGGIALPHFSDS